MKPISTILTTVLLLTLILLSSCQLRATPPVSKYIDSDERQEVEQDSMQVEEDSDNIPETSNTPSGTCTMTGGFSCGAFKAVKEGLRVAIINYLGDDVYDIDFTFQTREGSSVSCKESKQVYEGLADGESFTFNHLCQKEFLATQIGDLIIGDFTLIYVNEGEDESLTHIITGEIETKVEPSDDESFFITKCVMTGGFSCADFKASQEGLGLSAINNLGHDAEDVTLRFTSLPGSDVVCSDTITAPVTLMDRERFFVSPFCPERFAEASIGDIVSGDFLITYTKPDESRVKEAFGELRTLVER